LYFFIFCLFAAAHVFGWFQLNSQFLSEWWKDRFIVAAIVFGMPTGILFWHAWKHATEQFGSVWSARFMGSSIGIITFAILSWMLLGESIFTTKTLVCLVLAIIIIFIQLFC